MTLIELMNTDFFNRRGHREGPDEIERNFMG